MEENKNKPTYTFQNVADAILICAIAASNEDLTEDYYTTAELLGLYEFEPNAYKPPLPALTLALDAWEKAKGDDIYGAADPAVDAEAECLLRTGWTP